MVAGKQPTISGQKIIGGKATSHSVKPLSARADLPWERVISPKSSKVPEKSGPTLVTVSKDT